MSRSPSHLGVEYRLIMTTVVGLCLAGAAGSVVPGLDIVVGAVLIAAAMVACGSWVVRRELRIRRRLADTDGTLHLAPRRPAQVPAPRVGLGDRAPVSPAPTRLRVVAGPTAHATPASSPTAADRRLGPPTGGVA
ncbi:MAG: hypothetical protein JWO67_1519 [Streptosporangiaceae bacterium]|nr:hypothetical protein [Streptosporangiaceae bacterium]